MSYRCQECNCQVPHGEEQKKVITKKRSKVYENEDGFYLGEGYEIAEELSVCQECKDKLTPVE